MKRKCATSSTGSSGSSVRRGEESLPNYRMQRTRQGAPLMQTLGAAANEQAWNFPRTNLGTIRVGVPRMITPMKKAFEAAPPSRPGGRRTGGGLDGPASPSLARKRVAPDDANRPR